MGTGGIYLWVQPALTTSPDWNFVLRRPAHFLAFGFGSGLSPRAPGTAGSLAAIPIYLAMSRFLPPEWLLGLTGGAFAAGIWICEVTGKALGEEDFGGIVWDEIVAMWLVLAFAPSRWDGYVMAFILFRVFDIWKPFPIRTVEKRIGGGLGVMVDDLLAAGYAIAGLKLMGLIHG